MNCDTVAITDLSYGRPHGVDPGVLNVATTRVPWFESVFFTNTLTMEFLAKFKQPRHVIAEDNRLHELSKEQFLAWQRVNILRRMGEGCGNPWDT